MNQQEMKSVIEGLLFAVGDEGLDAGHIADVLEQSPKMITKLLQEMKEAYRTEQRGIQIVEIAGAYQLTTLPAHAPYFQKLAYTPTRGTLSQAALETLSIVAYRQPITRVEIEEIRGVKSDRAIQTLAAKELITEVARAEAIGRPILYGTTRQFLDYFGLGQIEELPNMEDFSSGELNLEEEAKLLFEKLDAKQLSIDDVNE
ncbi:SMC-Scp complex subunit ScpB [Marinicrinis sediminis]|uniref:Segregation and condensation protein B n=1 Tax=Marinicrinis sediminis TaxID=1652465 RepID=A0ABW5RD15_9BACL